MNRRSKRWVGTALPNFATPQDNPNFDNVYKNMVDLDIEVIELL